MQQPSPSPRTCVVANSECGGGVDSSTGGVDSSTDASSRIADAGVRSLAELEAVSFRRQRGRRHGHLADSEARPHAAETRVRWASRGYVGDA